MFIKFGAEEHLKALMNEGEMFFNPCKYFRDLEEEQKKKGIGDGNDGGIHITAEHIRMIMPNKEEIKESKKQVSFIVDRALNTPTFCLRKVDNEYITHEYRQKLKDQFPNHTHALIIRDESSFLENVRFHQKSRAFAHIIFYQDKMYMDYISFLRTGDSDISFYPTKAKKKYYAEIRYEPIDNPKEAESFFINDSNYYRTMFRKDMFFSDQKEYRLVLPHEEIIEGQKYYISPLDAELKSIDDLVMEG